ncbi:hypothetical protein AB0H00_24680 [Nocardia sp. NPDC023852]
MTSLESASDPPQIFPRSFIGVDALRGELIRQIAAALDGLV